jgi:hypothetical protein
MNLRLNDDLRAVEDVVERWTAREGLAGAQVGPLPPLIRSSIELLQQCVAPARGTRSTAAPLSLSLTIAHGMCPQLHVLGLGASTRFASLLPHRLPVVSMVLMVGAALEEALATPLSPLPAAPHRRSARRRLLQRGDAIRRPRGGSGLVEQVRPTSLPALDGHREPKSIQSEARLVI